MFSQCEKLGPELFAFDITSSAQWRSGLLGQHLDDLLGRTWAHSGIRLRSTSEVGAVGASRSPRLNEKTATSERWGGRHLHFGYRVSLSDLTNTQQPSGVLRLFDVDQGICVKARYRLEEYQ